MDQQKVFATAFRGFDKKAVLDYIYEQDMLFKKKEAEFETRISEYETQLSAQQQVETDDVDTEALLDELEQLRSRCRELEEQRDQAAEAAGEVAAQIEQANLENSRLAEKCETLESKLRILADHLMAEHVAEAAEPEAEPIAEEPEQLPELDIAYEPQMITEYEADEQLAEPREYTDLKEEMEDFRQQVSQTLLNLEASLARLESDKTYIPQEESHFFR